MTEVFVISEIIKFEETLTLLNPRLFYISQKPNLITVLLY